MIVKILQNRDIGKEEKYTIEFMLNSLGWFYEWISDKSELEKSEILLYYTAVNDSVKDTPNTFKLPKMIDLKNIASLKDRWYKKEINGNYIPLIGPAEEPEKRDNTPEILFDIVANIYFHLTRIEELEFTHPNQIDNKVKNSILYKFGLFKIPVVDILLEYFDEKLKNRLLTANPFIIKKSAYPRGEDFGLAVTHDVDIICAYHPVKKIVLSLLYYLKLSKSLSPQEMQTADQKIWGFDAIFEFYKKTGWKGVFFFIGRYTEGRHFRYRIGAKKIRAIIKELTKNGHEIAFHPSRFAFEHPSRYKKELQRLKEASNFSISGMRHHYLRCLYPQIWQTAEKLKLKYDAGLAYRRYSGFRAGTTRPFKTFIHNHRELTVWEFSTAFFEASIRHEKDPIISIIETVKNFGGLLNILWHTNNFDKENELFPIWLEITEELKKHNIFTATLKEHLKWQQQRNNISIKNINRSSRKISVEFDLKEKLRTFSLKIIPDIVNVKTNNRGNLSIEQNSGNIILNGETALDNIKLDFYLK